MGRHVGTTARDDRSLAQDVVFELVRGGVLGGFGPGAAWTAAFAAQGGDSPLFDELLARSIAYRVAAGLPARHPRASSAWVRPVPERLPSAPSAPPVASPPSPSPSPSSPDRALPVPPAPSAAPSAAPRFLGIGTRGAGGSGGIAWEVSRAFRAPTEEDADERLA